MDLAACKNPPWKGCPQASVVAMAQNYQDEGDAREPEGLPRV